MNRSQLALHAAKEWGFAPIQVESEYIQFLASLSRIADNRPTVAIEIGTANGGNLFSLLWYFDHVISVDLPGGPFGGLPNKEFRKRNRDIEKARATLSGRGHHLGTPHFVTGSSHDFATLGAVRDLLDEIKLAWVDLLFIDGDHSYLGVLTDYLMYRQLVRSSGKVVFHDIKSTDHHKQAGCEVSRLWEQLAGQKAEFCDNSHQWGGIGIQVQ